MAIELKPVASNVTRTEPDIAEAEVVNNAEVKRTWALSVVLVLSYRIANCVGLIQVNRNFNTLSTLSLAVSLMATWETVCSTIGSGLVSGGPVSLVYGFIRTTSTLRSTWTRLKSILAVSFIGNLCTAISLGELASMLVTANVPS
ncbi:hypothetical protein FJTKL_14843 [Diaporthe vaccinii]|uniref:Uncharacterized protein n=1 Tax=Diaporthe vaccinii TaxID=105482 RepID=A0ABR4F876_9PEZI